ncbi:MAG TPA: DNA-directed RNA polymerase subunit A' [Nitrososphaerales archaeon]|nr:DNA-directed RNA polymerase subunit A' [Nitrososphaerales archaeon]
MSMEQALKTIGGIDFAVFSPSEVRKYSVAEITQPETYDEDGMPVQGGLMDSRLGTLEPGQKCGTCGSTAGRCPGHFGHVELAEPVLHIAFVDEINKLVQTTCRSCGRILLPQPELDAYKVKNANKTDFTPTMLESVAKEIATKAKKVKLCPHCGKQQYQIEFTKPTIFHEITEEGGATRLLPIAIRERLERINNDDLDLLGFNAKAARPEWFVLQVLPVPPLTVRPSITLESGIRSEDDLTHKIVDILRVNQRVRESKESGTPHLIVQDLVDLLHYHVTTYFDNEVSGIPQAHHRSGRPLKTISQRLKGKEGRFRGSLSGKRVDFSSRTVISPDPSLDIGEVGVPFEVAKKLTIPEKVSPLNIEGLKLLVMRGPFEHPGANYVIRPDGVKIRLDFASDRKALADSLSPGYIVERHLNDGDVVLFNRQPSLHRMSVMAHFVHVLPYRTFRLHPSVCPPYNADFDGDEMNLHVPQSEESRSEALMLMKVQDQILSPRYGGPIIGGIRDFITGAFMLTRDETFLTPGEFSNLALLGGYEGDLPEPAKKGSKPLYTGKQLFSLFLPKKMNYVLTSKWAKSSKTGASNDVVIKDGTLISGVVDKAVIGAEEPDSLLHRIAKDYGNEDARNFLNSILKVLKTYLTRRGFTYGFNELELPDEAKKAIHDTLDEAYKNVADLIKKKNAGQLQLTRGLSPEDSLEAYIVNELSRARDRAGRIADRSFPAENSGMIMARTGARGSSLNVGQMTAALGQQSVRGKRIEKGLRGRALSHFSWNNQSPEAKGFVRSNYREGLSPTEFFFHAMGGREGLVDTAVRTQQSGYMQRRLVNALEHLKVEYDLTVRDPHGHIIQFLYGEDGVDPAKSDHGRPINLDRLLETEELLNKSRSKLDAETVVKLMKKYQPVLNERLVKELNDKLTGSYLTEEGAKESLERVAEALEYSRVEPGEASGIVAAQSIGEPGTQMTLRTFHFAGVRERDVTLGLPRLMELVDARKIPATPSMDIYFDKEYGATNEKAVKVAKEILFTKVGNVVEYSEVDPTEGIKLHLSEQQMLDRDAKAEEVAKVIETAKRKVQIEKGKIIRVNMENADLSMLFTLRNKILNMKLKGIPGITRVTVVKEGEEWFIQTAGSNLGKVVAVQGVDPTRVYTNNVHEVAQVLGIEAARSTLVREVMSTLDEQGLEVDIRHIFLVGDLMTSKGYIQQIGRHGIAGAKTSVLARAAFEITVPTLAEAAVKGETEDLKGVTENVIVGLPIPVGTGMIDLYMS